MDPCYQRFFSAVGMREPVSDSLPFLEFPVSEQIKRLREKREEIDNQRDELDKQREQLVKQRDELNNQISKLMAQQESQKQITLHSDVKVKGYCQQFCSSAKAAANSHDNGAP